MNVTSIKIAELAKKPAEDLTRKQLNLVGQYNALRVKRLEQDEKVEAITEKISELREQQKKLLTQGEELAKQITEIEAKEFVLGK